MTREHWDERYGTEELVWKAEPNRFLVEELQSLAPGRALDIACGEGRNSLWLASRGWRVTGIDFSAVGLAKARQMAAARQVEVTFIEADVLDWEPPEASFDLVVLFYLHLPSEQRRRVLANAATSLAVGGTALIVGHDTTNLVHGTGGPQDPTLLYGPEEIAGELPGLRVERAARVTRVVATESGEVSAIDALVRAVRPA
ncbi:MAG: class I SAM-dependent methyltransferase [Acidimicrobiales bacterium]